MSVVTDHGPDFAMTARGMRARRHDDRGLAPGHATAPATGPFTGCLGRALASLLRAARSVRECGTARTASMLTFPPRIG